ncbi:dnaJ-like protein 60 [Maniola hyperantus]|uniref:dnaJ-like protein 60 n=1 Tax=Aphantopus hyperantus TaxID=2795564 RepID=UPI001568EEC8|nr:dnaJ-like protein 60 [Maniola hyperantus]
MYLLKRRPEFKTICTLVRLYNSSRKSHYDILNLQRNCTEKEIKEAFIKLSKEYHPDKNKSSKAAEQFVRIVEAYNVLSKPGSRASYDSTAEYDSSGSYVYRTHVPYNLRNNPNYGFYTHTQTKSGNTNRDYYGIKGVKKLPNIAIIMIAFGIAFIGVLLQVVVIRQSYSSQRKRIDQKSMMLAEELEKVRASARGQTNDAQTQMMLDKIVAASNRSVATASLGQTLADEKK